MLTDRDIMLRVQAGEISLFAELVSRYEAKLLRFANSKLVHVSQAEDLVQETLLAAFQARATYSPEFAFSTWIWTILLNLSRRQHRKLQSHEKTVREYVKRTQQQSTLKNSIPQLLIQSELTEQLHAWLEQLSEAQADAIRLRFFGELPYEDIALAMNISLSGAKRRVKTGLLKLAELVRSQQAES